jgi:hypothetical protein
MTDIALIADAIRQIRPTSHYGVKGDGADGYIITWEDDSTTEPTPAEITAAMDGAKWDHVRSDRNRKLDGCDWTAVDDNVLSDSKRAEWQTYRQGLRDITSQGDPDNVTWPTPPEEE